MQLYEQIEKEFDEQFPREGGDTIYRYGRLDYPEGDERSQKSFLKQSFIQFLENECERLKKEIAELDEKGGRNHLHRIYGIEAREDTISHYQNMIKELQR